MDLHSGTADSAEAPPTTLPPGPRRIHDRRGWRRLRGVGLAALAGLGGGLITAWSLADALPPAMRLPQPAGAVPAQDLFVPMLLAALGLLTLWRLSAWVLPLVMAGLLLGAGLPLLFKTPADPSAALGLATLVVGAACGAILIRHARPAALLPALAAIVLVIHGGLIFALTSCRFFALRKTRSSPFASYNPFP